MDMMPYVSRAAAAYFQTTQEDLFHHGGSDEYRFYRLQCIYLAAREFHIPFKRIVRASNRATGTVQRAYYRATGEGSLSQMTDAEQIVRIAQWLCDEDEIECLAAKYIELTASVEGSRAMYGHLGKV